MSQIAFKDTRIWFLSYILVHGIGSFIISGGAEFGIAYSMYAKSAYKVTLWGFPNTFSGDCALTIFIQTCATWLIEEILVGWDIRSDKINPTFVWFNNNFQTKFINYIINWYFETGMTTLSKSTELELMGYKNFKYYYYYSQDDGDDTKDKFGILRYLQKLVSHNQLQFEIIKYNNNYPYLGFQQDEENSNLVGLNELPYPSYYPQIYGNIETTYFGIPFIKVKKPKAPILKLLLWLTNKICRGLILAAILFIFIWPITMGIMASIGTREPGTVEYTFHHFRTPQVAKLLYGGIIGLLLTPVISGIILTRHNWMMKEITELKEGESPDIHEKELDSDDNTAVEDNIEKEDQDQDQDEDQDIDGDGDSDIPLESQLTA
ncbi:hypothetical protein BVG19_g2974 [[Candida] boidinii]|nr:hypothetical protein BVG19_g2974 [[Candida] boidinii]OWB50437.1 hypothetical protein B5S27_g1987 [[Candida] boidinii]